MLNLVDVSKNSDKYYILQVIVDPAGNYHTWARWGRTGTAGQSQQWDAKDEEDAIRIFAGKFLEKTGNEWSDHDSFELQPGKYKLLKTDYVAVANKAPVMWQYYVDDYVDGKQEGWYDYDDNASAIVEKLHDELLYNHELTTRLVESGSWVYKVDLGQMRQTNTSTSKTRMIRRVVLSKGPGKNSRSGAAAAAAASPTPAPPTPPGAGLRKRVAAAAAAPSAPATPPPVAKKTKVAAAAVSADAAAAAAGSGEVDPACPLAGSGGQVVGEYDVSLNQTDIGTNANKFYRAQLVESGGHFYLWTRWGRVGETGATQMDGPFNEEDGVKAFCKKFKDKTGNNFDDRHNFVPKPKKYVLIALEAGVKEEVKEEEEEDVKPKVKAEPGASSVLDPATRAFVEFIFSENMFKDAMQHLELDIKKMPLGRLSQAQVQRGMDVLEEIEAEIKGRARLTELQLLSSKFYTVIPHSFGRQRPPVIDSLNVVQQKYDLCNVLKDIEAAQKMVSSSAQGAHPADAKYAELHADLEPVKGGKELNMVKEYIKNTIGSPYHHQVNLENVWRVNRHNESTRFGAHKSLQNRKLLWHGTNAAVVAAILQSGLRIMPHSGGRVGCGIYLASECNKSIGYVCPGNDARGRRLGCMFLVEAALGKEHSITRDDSSLKRAPPGFDSIVARGCKEPDPASDITVSIDGNSVTVPLGVPKPMPQYSQSSFSQSEYLLYQESQHRIRYVLTFTF